MCRAVSRPSCAIIMHTVVEPICCHAVNTTKVQPTQMHTGFSDAAAVRMSIGSMTGFEALSSLAAMDFISHLGYKLGSTPSPLQPPTPSATPTLDFIQYDASSPPVAAFSGCGMLADAALNQALVRRLLSGPFLAEVARRRTLKQFTGPTRWTDGRNRAAFRAQVAMANVCAALCGCPRQCRNGKSSAEVAKCESQYSDPRSPWAARIVAKNC